MTKQGKKNLHSKNGAYHPVTYEMQAAWQRFSLSLPEVDLLLSAGTTLRTLFKSSDFGQDKGFKFKIENGRR
jgi:hypothetical protein